MARIEFANQLRGVAALAVACGHLFGVFWSMPDVVAAATFTPPLAGPGDLLSIGYAPWFNPGPFGVALFFLISGFVIPFSLEKHGRGSFLLARALRIYPTYLVALAAQMTLVYAASRIWHLPFTHSARTIAGNALLIYDLVGQSSVDLVNWTLSVELKFYLLVALVAPAIRRGSMPTLVGIATAIFALNEATSLGWLHWARLGPATLRYTLGSQPLCLTYMLIGTAFNAHLRGIIRTPALLATVAILATLFALTWPASSWADQFPSVTYNYGFGLAVFAALYAARRLFRANALLDAMAAISFPFYLLHSLVGYTVLKALILGLGWSYPPALAATVLLIIAAATTLHRLVERPSMRAGRRIGIRPQSTPGPIPEPRPEPAYALRPL